MKLTVKIDATFEADTAEDLFAAAGQLIGHELVKNFGPKGRDYEKNLAHMNEVEESTVAIEFGVVKV